MQAPNSNANQKYLPASLEGAATAMWPTATAEDAESSQARREKDVTLTEAVKLWPTPRKQEAESGPDYARRGRSNSGGDDLTTDQVHSLPALTTTPPGSGSSETAPSSRPRQWLTPQTPSPHDSDNTVGTGRRNQRGLDHQAIELTGRPKLNPLFVEWLMGWPIGWTSLAPLGSGSRETA
jgi:DNA (cytosine-5)-methyltransferase 1